MPTSTAPQNNIPETLTFSEALQKRGFIAKLTAGGTGFTVEPNDKISPGLRSKIKQNRDGILAELLAANAIKEYKEAKTDQAICFAEQSEHKISAKHLSDPLMDVLLWESDWTNPAIDHYLTDSKLWISLLQKACDAKSSLLWTLHGFRCAGARIQRSVTGYSLRFDSASADIGGFRSIEDFNNAFAEYIRKDDVISRADSELTKLLTQLA